MAVARTIYLNDETEYKTKVDALAAKGHRIVKKETNYTVLKEKKFGTLFEHILIFIISFGLFNAFWAVWCWKKADEVEVYFDANAENTDNLMDKQKSKSDELIWKIFLVIMAFLVVMTYFFTFTNIQSKNRAKAMAAKKAEALLKQKENQDLIPDIEIKELEREAPEKTENFLD